MKTIAEHEAYEQYDDFLNEVYNPLKIGQIEFDPARVLKELDPIAYQCGFNDWMDSEAMEVEDLVNY